MIVNDLVALMQLTQEACVIGMLHTRHIQNVQGQEGRADRTGSPLGATFIRPENKRRFVLQHHIGGRRCAARDPVCHEPGLDIDGAEWWQMVTEEDENGFAVALRRPFHQPCKARIGIHGALRIGTDRLARVLAGVSLHLKFGIRVTIGFVGAMSLKRDGKEEERRIHGICFADDFIGQSSVGGQ